MSDPAATGRFGTPLTPRELVVLVAVAEADGYIAAAAALGISPNTVKATLANARSRLGCRTSLGAYRIAVQRGLIDPRSRVA